jgi:ribosomal protein S27E
MQIPDESDIAILENHTHKTLKDGCKECGFMHIVFQACISIEMESKIFFLSVECPMCESTYKDIMIAIPLNEYEKERHDYDRSINN